MNETVSAFAEFFNDFIGYVVPGSVLFALLVLFFEWPFSISEEAAVSTGGVLLWVALSYATGHILSATVTRLGPALSRIGLFVNEAAYLDGEKRELVSDARRALGIAADAKLTSREIRSKLMTASKEAKQLAVRFMHITQLCNGVAFAIVIAGCARLYAISFSRSLLRTESLPWDLLIVQSVVMIGVACLLLKRGVEFHRRSLAIPFTVGPEDLRRENAASNSTGRTGGSEK